MNRRNFIKGIITTGVVIAIQPSFAISPTNKVINFDELVATTLKQYRTILADNITKQSPIWNHFLNLKERNV